MEVCSPLKELLSRLEKDEDRSLLFFREEELRIKVEHLTKSKIQERYAFLYFKSKKREGCKKNWTDQEIQYLLYLADKICYFWQKPLENLEISCWETVSQMTPGRMAIDCMFKTLSLKKYSLSEYPWSSDEDQLFRQIIQATGQKWDQVSRTLYLRASPKVFRNSKVCREHFMCFFNPTIRKGAWRTDQDYNLACCYLRFGRRWSRMTKEIQGRNQNSIKNRFFLLFETNRNKKIRNSRSIDSRVTNFKAKYQNENDIIKEINRPKVIQVTIQSKKQNQLKQEEESFSRNDRLDFPPYFENYMNCLEL